MILATPAASMLLALPTERACCECGVLNRGLTLAERLFRCEECGSERDRELNAALNLLRAVSFTNLRDLKPVERSALASVFAEVKRSSMKQEPGPDQI